MCPYVPTRWFDEDGYLLLDTSSRLDLSLNGIGLRSGRMPKLRERDGFAVYLVDEVTVLGLTRPKGEVTAFASSSEGTVFGTVGALFFLGATLAIDPAGPHVAVTKRIGSISRGCGSYFLEWLGESGLPVTEGITVAAAPDHRFATLLSTGSPASYASRRLAERLPRKLIQHGRYSELMLAPHWVADVRLQVRDEMPQYAVDVGVDGIDLVVGMDVLMNILSVFDFGYRRTRLQPYEGIE